MLSRSAAMRDGTADAIGRFPSLQSVAAVRAFDASRLRRPAPSDLIEAVLGYNAVILRS